MQEYMDNGAQLGWLIDPVRQRVFIYRPDSPVEQLDKPDSVSAEPVLPGFRLDLREIW
jgi:Uma2 family endonuclease